MEKEIRVQDDLYEYVNHEWLETAVIPEDKPATGGFNILADGVEKLLMDEFEQMSEGTLSYPDENVKKAVKLYMLGKDSKKRNREGIRPILKTLKKIESLKNISSFNRHLTEFVKMGLPLPFELEVTEDMKDSSHYSLMIGGPSTILPDTVYYQEGMKEQHDALIGLWTQMAKGILSFTKLSEEDIELYIKDAIAFDAIIATLVKSREELSEYTKMYNPMSSTRVGTLVKPIKYKKLLTELFVTVPEKTIVADPRFLKGFKTLFNEENFELYKHWAYIKALEDGSVYLSEKLCEVGTSYVRALAGIAKVSSMEKQAYRTASSQFSEPIGYYYGVKYFGEEAKKDINEMVQEIIDTYKRRIKDSTILEEETKKTAILKLSKMHVKMGYPDKVDSFYDTLDFSEDASFYTALQELHVLKTEHSFSKLYQEVDKELWVMPGHMVNACYNPFANDITFPAAILQAPFYSIKQTRSQNLGGIGAVIGHEISHAFDNNGSNCDENGNIRNWWTATDYKNFKQKTKAMIKQFDGIELAGAKVNGALVVSENIADNGGMAVTLNIMSHMENKDYKEYFYNWAKVWCQKAKPEYIRLIMSIDVHSPTVLRANMTPRNFQEWYDTFDVKSTDKMYIAPKKRITVW